MLSRETLAKGAELIRDGQTFKAAARVLKVNVSTLTSTMLKYGLSARALRPPDILQDEKLKLAVTLYKSGVLVSEIIRKTGIAERTLYSQLHRQGVPVRQPRTSS